MLSSAVVPASLADSFTLAACSEAVAAASRIAAATACIAASSPVLVWAAVPAAIYSSSPCFEAASVGKASMGPLAPASDGVRITSDSKDRLLDDHCRSHDVAVT